MANRLSNIAAALASAMFLYVGPAWAEVCDKIEPRWDPVRGPVTIYHEIYWTLLSPAGIVILVSAILTVLLRSWLLRAAVGVGIGVLGLISIFAEAGDNDVAAFSIAEGCRTGFPTFGLLLVTVGSAVTLFGLLRRA